MSEVTWEYRVVKTSAGFNIVEVYSDGSGTETLLDHNYESLDELRADLVDMLHATYRRAVVEGM